MDLRDPAQIKDAALPDQLERVAEHRLLARLRGVGRVEDQSGPGSQQPDGHAFAAVSFPKAIRDARAEDPVDPTLEDGGRLLSPVGVNDDNPLGRLQLIAMLLDELGNRPAFRNLHPRKGRIKTLGTQVVECDRMTLCPQPLRHAVGNRVVETRGAGMTQDEQDVHGEPGPNVPSARLCRITRFPSGSRISIAQHTE